MSRIPVGRPAVFTRQSPEVEVCLDGSWRPGSILGWRHDEGGGCEVRVRAVVAGAPFEVWVDLATLRLPEQPAPAPPTVTLAMTSQAASQAAPAGTRAADGTQAATVTLTRAAARERLVAGVLAAPELAADGSAAGRRRRHRGDGTAEFPAVSAGALAGRHRAPADGGRHRAADEGPAPDGARPATATVGAARPEVDCLTRPLRLGDRPSRPRLPRPDAVLRA